MGIVVRQIVRTYGNRRAADGARHGHNPPLANPCRTSRMATSIVNGRDVRPRRFLTGLANKVRVIGMAFQTEECRACRLPNGCISFR